MCKQAAGTVFPGEYFYGLIDAFEAVGLAATTTPPSRGKLGVCMHCVIITQRNYYKCVYGIKGNLGSTLLNILGLKESVHAIMYVPLFTKYNNFKKMEALFLAT